MVAANASKIQANKQTKTNEIQYKYNNKKTVEWFLSFVVPSLYKYKNDQTKRKFPWKLLTVTMTDSKEVKLRNKCPSDSSSDATSYP